MSISGDEQICVDDDEIDPHTVQPKVGPVKLPTKTRLSITVRKLHMTAEWKWSEGGEDTCGICRMEFEAACTNCKFPGDECPLVVGGCRHAFHKHCIDKWTAAPTNQPTPQCPLCRQEWKNAS